MFKKVYIEITNHCNLKCSFCKTNVRKKIYLSTENFKIILNKIKEDTKYVYLHVLGEPFLHPQLKTMILLCQAHGLQVNLTTNGTLLHKAHWIADAEIQNIHQINISLHSDFETVMDTEQYLAQLQAFLLLVREKMYVNLRLWNEDHHQLDSILALSEKNKKMLIRIAEGLGTSFEEAPPLKKGLGRKIDERVFLHVDKVFTWPDLKGDILLKQGRCYGLRDQIGILCDGTVVPCCLDGEGVLALGNIFEQELSNILSSERAQKIKEGFLRNEMVEGYCQRCGFAVRNNKHR